MTLKDGSKTDRVITLRVNIAQLAAYLARMGITIVDAVTYLAETPLDKDIQREIDAGMITGLTDKLMEFQRGQVVFRDDDLGAAGVSPRPDLQAAIDRARQQNIDANGVPTDTLIPESNQIGRVIVNRSFIPDVVFWDRLLNHAIIYGSRPWDDDHVEISIKSPQLAEHHGIEAIPYYDCIVNDLTGEIIFEPRPTIDTAGD